MLSKGTKLLGAMALWAVAVWGAGPVREIGSGESGALQGRNIALWHSHGRYYDSGEDRWKWQRCRLFGTVEDLYTRSYVVPLLVPMLENAGAYVWLPRERDESDFEVVIDPDGAYACNGYAEHNGKQKWQAAETGFGLPTATLSPGENPFRLGAARQIKAAHDKLASAFWSAGISRTGDYAVYVSYPALDKAVGDAHYTVHTAAGDRRFLVDQTMAAGTWVYLGRFPFEASGTEQRIVTLTNESATGGWVGADAVRVGGGMGSVERGDRVSGMPRWAEAARYWLQYAGMPEEVYASEENDYRDDIFCRPQWVNHLKETMKVPIDMTLAFHSDAGTLGGDSIVGTLGICFTDKKRGKFKDGRSRKASQRLAQEIVGSVVGDIRQLYDSTWTQRPLKDARYIEARIPETPTLLLELLSHQNLADMRYGLDPQFRFDVARAVYKGILRYLAPNKEVQPLAPQRLSLTSLAAGSYVLQWKPRADPLEPTAMARDYIVEVREGFGPFKKLTETADTMLIVNIPQGEICSYRITARNRGGRSFPSEVLAAGHVADSKGDVRVVNGFTRVAGPDVFVAGDMAGFGIPAPGVAPGQDWSYTGMQYNFDRTAPWADDDQPGFGASRANMEAKPVYGNSFDNVIAHGEAIMAAGYSFDSQSVEAFEADSRQPQAVDLILGLQKETKIGAGQRQASHKVFPAALQERLRQLAGNGSRLFVSGSYVASDGGAESFLSEVLGVGLRSANASGVGSVSEVRSAYSLEFPGATFTYSDRIGQRPYAVTCPDAIIPVAAGAAIVMRYDENQSPAAVAFVADTHRALTLGFPFEAVEQRNVLMKQILNFLK